MSRPRGRSRMDFANRPCECLTRNLRGSTHPLQPAERCSSFGPIIREALNSGGTSGVEAWFGQLNDLQKKEAFVHAVWAIKDADLDVLTSWD